MMRFVVIDNCPVPEKAAPFVAEAKRRSGETLNSCFRGQEARDILARFGKHDQSYLYQGWLRRLPGFNPANPPGFSSHECRCDGVFPPGFSRGSRIPDEMVGSDWSNGHHVADTYRSMGIPAVMPYSSPLEAQHVDIATVPAALTKPTLKVGARDKAVQRIRHRLHAAVRPHAKGARYLPTDNRSQDFDQNLDHVVRDFQHDHGLTVDGVVGPNTWAQLDYAMKYWQKKRADAAKAKKDDKKKGGKGKGNKPKPHPSHQRTSYKMIDVSNNNGDIDWQAVARSGVVAACIRCTEGLSGHGSEDEFFTAGRIKAMRQAKVIPSYYHFARPRPGRSGAVEARHFFYHADSVGAWDVPVFLPPWLDAEAVVGLGPGDLVRWYHDFLNELERLVTNRVGKSRRQQIKDITGYDPCIPFVYTGGWFWNPHTADDKSFSKYPLAYSYYTPDHHFPPQIPRSWSYIAVLQWWDKGRVPGVNGDCDLDTLYGYIDLQRAHALL